jgi:hypothetical protein
MRINVGKQVISADINFVDVKSEGVLTANNFNTPKPSMHLCVSALLREKN